MQIADYSSGRAMRWNERLAFRAAARDPVLGAAIEGSVTRRRSFFELLDPRLAPRLLRSALRTWELVAG